MNQAYLTQPEVDTLLKPLLVGKCPHHITHLEFRGYWFWRPRTVSVCNCCGEVIE